MKMTMKGGKMKIIEQSWEWIQKPTNPLQLIELAGRTCYKSETQITPDSAAKFVKRITESGHHSVIEHANATVRFITDRGVTHELVRHRLAAYSQESTRYCNYGGKDIVFILPVWMDKMWAAGGFGLYLEKGLGLETEREWVDAMLNSEFAYNRLLLMGWRPEQARAVLPNSLKTEIIMTANVREWRHVFNLRTSKAAHPQIRELMLDCLKGFQEAIPVIFDDIGK
jgi:thymidylate synthase (FAD)